MNNLDKEDMLAGICCLIILIFVASLTLLSLQGCRESEPLTQIPDAGHEAADASDSTNPDASSFPDAKEDVGHRWLEVAETNRDLQLARPDCIQLWRTDLVCDDMHVGQQVSIYPSSVIAGLETPLVQGAAAVIVSDSLQLWGYDCSETTEFNQIVPTWECF